MLIITNKSDSYTRLQQCVNGQHVTLSWVREGSDEHEINGLKEIKSLRQKWQDEIDEAQKNMNLNVSWIEAKGIVRINSRDSEGLFKDEKKWKVPFWLPLWQVMLDVCGEDFNDYRKEWKDSLRIVLSAQDNKVWSGHWMTLDLNDLRCEPLSQEEEEERAYWIIKPNMLIKNMAKKPWAFRALREMWNEVKSLNHPQSNDIQKEWIQALIFPQGWLDKEEIERWTEFFGFCKKERWNLNEFKDECGYTLWTRLAAYEGFLKEVAHQWNGEVPLDFKTIQKIPSRDEVDHFHEQLPKTPLGMALFSGAHQNIVWIRDQISTNEIFKTCEYIESLNMEALQYADESMEKEIESVRQYARTKMELLNLSKEIHSMPMESNPSTEIKRKAKKL